MIIRYRYDEATRRNREDAAWYVDGDGHAWVATVTDNGASIDIYCDGDMRVSIDNNPDATICSQLVDCGITTDVELSEAEMNGRITWHNNAWYDLYDGETGEHINYVTHTVSDAVAAAITMLTRQVAK